jgi:hypothetical protein
MPETRPPLDPLSAGLADIVRYAEGDRLPPVDSWNPDHCGDSGMRIASDGTWFHEGSPIGRIAMVRQFSRVLRGEPDGSYVLVTPVEKLSIQVDDAPFLAVEMKSEGECDARRLAFRLNTGDFVVAGPDHPIRFDVKDDGPHPYLLVRGRLEALITRSLYYELAEIALAEDADPPGFWSDGAFFAIDAGE